MKLLGKQRNGEEALTFVQAERPDVVLMDLSMPKMDGIEATKRIKQYDETIKILMLSSFSEQDYVLPALEAGADGYQLKEVRTRSTRCVNRCGISRKCKFSPESNTSTIRTISSQERKRESFFYVNKKGARSTS